MNNLGLISIIVPVYNVEQYLSRCVNSILSQYYKHIELILVDDGSIDNSGAVCDEYAAKDSRVKVIHKENGGQSSARNVGLDIARGEYIGFVDSDDWIVPDMYSFLYKLITENDADIANIKCIKAYSDRVNIGDVDDSYQIYENEACLENLLREGTVGVLATYGVYRGLYKKELFNGIRFQKGRINEDIVYSYQLYDRAKKVVVSNKVAYFYFQSKNSTTRKKLRKRDFDLLWACETLEDLSRDKSNSIKYFVDVKKARSYFSLLSKVAFYGIDKSELDDKLVIKSLTDKVRGQYLFLMNSPIPITRKIVLSLLCIHINMIRIPLSVLRKIKSF